MHQLANPLLQVAIQLCFSLNTGWRLLQLSCNSGLRQRLRTEQDAAEADNGTEALRLAELHQPDIIFLDIQMPGLDGLKVFKQLASKPAVIFCSAYAEYAVTAFELSAVDYLLKPFSAERFQQALFKACGKIIDKLNRGGSKPEAIPSYIDRLTIRDPGRLRIVEVSDISWIESAGNYIDIHVYSQRKSYLLRDTMAAIEKKLDPALFARIHRSTIINLGQVKDIEALDSGDYEVRLHNGQQLTLSRRYRERFKAMLSLS